MKTRRLLTGILGLALGSVFCISMAANPNDPAAAKLLKATSDTGLNKEIPVAGWRVDSQAFINSNKANSAGKPGTKAATDLATVFRPITPCRLIDTRGAGTGGAITLVGPLAANSTHNIFAAGFCGIPNNGEVGGISVSFHLFNYTPNNGGYIAFQQIGAPVTGVNAVFNFGIQWTATTANISIPNDSGNFSVTNLLSQIDLIIDVNGYYQDLNSLDVGTQELDIIGTVAGTGDLFQVRNNGTGSAISADNFTAGGTSLTISGGAVRAAGAGVNSDTFVFIHQVNTATAFGAGAGNICGGFPEYTVIDHPMLNGDANAIVLFTPREVASAPNVGTPGTYDAFYFQGGCTPTVNGFWGIRNLSGTAQVNASQFSVMVIKP